MSDSQLDCVSSRGNGQWAFLLRAGLITKNRRKNYYFPNCSESHISYYRKKPSYVSTEAHHQRATFILSLCHGIFTENNDARLILRRKLNETTTWKSQTWKPRVATVDSCFYLIGSRQLGVVSNASTVEPVLSGPVLNGHPLLSGQLSKSRKLLPLITVILTSIKRSRSPFTKSRRAVSIVLTCTKRSLCKRKPLKYYSSSYNYK